MRFTFASLLIVLTATCLNSQTRINPVIQINWPLVTGSGAPTIACSSIYYGMSYQNTAVTPNTRYHCAADGWELEPVAGSGTVGPGTTGYIPVFTGNTSIGNSVIDQGVTTAGEVTLPWNITPRAVGYHAAFSNTTGNDWTANGYEAGYSNVCGSGWTFFGYQAGYNNNACGSTPGVPNQAIGNTAIGYQAGYTNTAGLSWLAIGYQAGYSNTRGDWLAIGEKAGYANTSGTSWTAVGIEAGENNTEGDDWTALGEYAGYSSTTGSNWTAIGNSAGSRNTSGNDWTAVGEYAGKRNNTGDQWTAVGSNAGGSSTTGYQWTALGGYAGSSNTTGDQWTAVGSSAGDSSTTGYQWTAVGSSAGSNITTGSNWTAIGFQAGEYIADGSTPNRTGDSSLYLGANAYPLADGDTNEIVIGYSSTGHGSNTTTFGNPSTTALYVGNTLITSGFANPMTTLGDTIYGGASGAATRLPGNTTVTKRFLSQTGNGTNSAAPVWAAIVAADIPTLNQDTTGTASNITATSNSTLTTLSALSLPYSQLTGTPSAATWASITGGTQTGSGTSQVNTFPGSITATSYNSAPISWFGTGNGNIGGALPSTSTGSYNTAQGQGALSFNTTGSDNSAQGVNALQFNTTGSNNSAQGFSALSSNTTGGNNTAQGFSALSSNTTGSSNAALGFSAGRYISNGSTPNTTSSNSVYMGVVTEALASGDTNENVIGYGATGHGSNTSTLGNTSITDTYLQGNTHVGASGTNLLYRCTTAGALPIGALTIATGNCGVSVSTGLYVQ